MTPAKNYICILLFKIAEFSSSAEKSHPCPLKAVSNEVINAKLSRAEICVQGSLSPGGSAVLVEK